MEGKLDLLKLWSGGRWWNLEIGWVSFHNKSTVCHHEYENVHVRVSSGVKVCVCVTVPWRENSEKSLFYEQRQGGR